MIRNCRHCRYLTRTSPEQVFLLCEFWASSSHHHPVRGATKGVDYDYVVAHCHVQPEAPACDYFEDRRPMLEIPLFDPDEPPRQSPRRSRNVPGDCPHEISVADMSGDGNLKSECDLTIGKLGHSMWTNCRVYGSCTLAVDQ